MDPIDRLGLSAKPPQPRVQLAFPDEMQQVNRTCKACRLSKLKCDLTTSTQEQSEARRCSRCTRLNLDCVQESRGNSGRSRLKAPGICTLKRDNPERFGTVIEMLTRTALVSTGAQQVLAAPLLRWCGQEAWSRNDTKLMSWVLEQAAARGLPLSDFAPGLFSAAVPAQLEPTGTGTPPPFIRALLGGGYNDALGIAYHQSGTRSDWIPNDIFDQRVCSRRALQDARALPACSVSALFAAADEVEPFEREVVGALFAALAPVLGDECDATSTEAAATDADASGEQAGAQPTLHSEIVNSTSLWRLRLQGAAVQVDDEHVVCKVVMRCAVLRGGEDVWMVCSYVPQIAADGSWVTSKEAPHAKTAADRASGGATSTSKPPPRKRRAKSCEEDAIEPPPPPASRTPCSPGAAFAELHADALLQQLQATSADEVLRMLEEEEGSGGAR